MKRHTKANIKTLASLILFTVCVPVSTSSQAQAYLPEENKETRKKLKFNTAFIKEFNSDIDISYFENDDLLLPGVRPVEVVINQRNLGVHDINFIRSGSDINPCVPVSFFESVNINKLALPEGWPEQHCVDPSTTLTGARAIYDYDSERLSITVPQKYLSTLPEGYIDPSRWDEGIDALSVNYSLTGSNINYRDSRKASSLYYGNFLSTFRNGPWRFTTYDSVSGGSEQTNRLNHMQAYAQRSIGSIFSQLSLGDLNTTGEVFDSTSLRGVILRSDDRMHPRTVKGYAPQVRGIANGNAVVTVRQNNIIIYEKNVPPGEFIFNDIAAMGYGSELEVTIKENDGSQRVFWVPYSSMPQLLRKGYYRYSLATGEVRSYGLTERPHFLESQLQYGVSNAVTLYGGLQTALENQYSAVNSGMAVNTRLGALSVDVTKSWFNNAGEKKSKKSFANESLFKFGLSKRVDHTDTTFDVISYHLAGDNYYSLNDAVIVSDQRKHGKSKWHPEKFRHRLEITVSQLFSPGWGELTVSGWLQNGQKTEMSDNSRSSLLVGYRNNLGVVNYSLNINKTLLENKKSDTAYYLNLSAPFGSPDKKRPTIRTSLSYSSDESKLRVGVNGTHQGEESSSFFNTWFSQSSKSMSNFGINTGHTGTALQKSIGYGQGMKYYSASASLGGGFLIHDNGVVFAPYVSDTMALIEAPGATGGNILGNKKAKINSAGYGLVSYISPFEENMLTLDLKGTPLGFDSDENSKTVIPTAGAVVKVPIKNNRVKSVIGRLKLSSGRYVPYGSRLYDEKGGVTSTVGQSGIIIFPVSDPNEPLIVKWNDRGINRTCTVHPWESEGNKQNSQDKALTCKSFEDESNKS